MNDFIDKNTSLDSDAGLTCKEVDSFLVDYLDGELADAELQKFESHLQVCPACDTYLTGYKKTIEKSKEVYTKELEGDCEEVPDSLVRAIIAARK